jgi:nucleotide-binding universal stress UspA family protein
MTPEAPNGEDRALRLPDVPEIGMVLCPVDGSPGSEKGLAMAARVASLTGAEVVVVVAFNPPVAVRRRGILAAEQARAELEEDARELAEEATGLLLKRGLRARGLAVEGDPVEAILETASREEAGLIVMGRRGLGRLQGLLVGSVSERVARHAEVPVLMTS